MSGINRCQAFEASGVWSWVSDIRKHPIGYFLPKVRCHIPNARDKMTDIEKLTKDTINKGGVLATVYFDLHSDSSDKLRNLATGFVDSILKQEGVITSYGEIEEPIEQNGTFTTTIEVKILVKDFLSLLNVCSVFNPLTVEILKPNEINMSLDKAHELLMNASSNWFNIKKYITERVSSKEDIAGFKKYLENRTEIGKKLLEKKGAE